MSKIIFEDLEFRSIWVDEIENKFYRWGWEFLEEKGFTNYDNIKEECLVLLNKHALEMIYGEFCDVAYDEFYSFEEDELDYPLGDITISQLYGEITGKLEDSSSYFKTDFDEEMLEIVVDNQRNSLTKLMLNSKTPLELLNILTHASGQEIIPHNEGAALEWIEEGMMKYR